MRRTLVAAGSFALLLGSATTAVAVEEDGTPDAPRVVATGLDNPRQLNWAEDGSLLVAEAGSGGDTCVALPEAPSGEEPPAEEPPVEEPPVEPPPAEEPPVEPPPAEEPPAEEPPAQLCAGGTAGVTAISDPEADEPEAARVVDGLFSLAGPDGSFAEAGSSGADGTDVPGQYIVVEGGPPPFPIPGITDLPGAETLGNLLVAEVVDGEQAVFPYVDFVDVEAEQNPDGAQLESNPFSILFVDPTPDGPAGADGYALVADAAANTVWKVQPDFAAVPEDCATGTPANPTACVPPFEVTVFATYPTVEGDETTPEFVPTSLAADADGNVYVGGLGSLVPGAGEARVYTAEGDAILTLHGFTGITGVAVEDDGSRLYVSQLFGSTPDFESTEPQGNVVAVDLADLSYRSVDVPFPAGLAVGDDGVFVSAFSIAPAEGLVLPGGDGTPLPDTGGQVWEISFDGVEPAPLPVAAAGEAPEPTTPDPTTPDPTTPEPTTSDPATPAPQDDDGTPDQGPGDAAP
ncbi:ScyD/ScyE family protein [Geodermatophilus sp. DF01-2]|uniref:ScyD/ScyE family protein n=1 Tax=Geodermatophilus sp. DF01-2 TaxID=2559610 RepID=UPI00107314A8|nr:ScyD/ScyE family protein [Geodermatophilus sp. DF01_2]TFV59544.1 ScyD/ScyE family protein [Geodermatophilus sp. DF01_2]